MVRQVLNVDHYDIERLRGGEYDIEVRVTLDKFLEEHGYGVDHKVQLVSDSNDLDAQITDVYAAPGNGEWDLVFTVAKVYK